MPATKPSSFLFRWTIPCWEVWGMPAVPLAPSPSTKIYGMAPTQRLHWLYLVKVPPGIAPEGRMATTLVIYVKLSACWDPLHTANCRLPEEPGPTFNKQTNKKIPLSMSCYKQSKQAAGPHLKRCYINFKRNLQIFIMQIFLGKQKAAVYSSLYLLAGKQNPGCLYFFF